MTTNSTLDMYLLIGIVQNKTSLHGGWDRAVGKTVHIFTQEGLKRSTQRDGVATSSTADTEMGAMQEFALTQSKQSALHAATSW